MARAVAPCGCLCFTWPGAVLLQRTMMQSIVHDLVDGGDVADNGVKRSLLPAPTSPISTANDRRAGLGDGGSDSDSDSESSVVRRRVSSDASPATASASDSKTWESGGGGGGGGATRAVEVVPSDSKADFEKAFLFHSFSKGDVDSTSMSTSTNASAAVDRLLSPQSSLYYTSRLLQSPAPPSPSPVPAPLVSGGGGGGGSGSGGDTHAPRRRSSSYVNGARVRLSPRIQLPPFPSTPRDPSPYRSKSRSPRSHSRTRALVSPSPSQQLSPRTPRHCETPDVHPLRSLHHGSYRGAMLVSPTPPEGRALSSQRSGTTLSSPRSGTTLSVRGERGAVVSPSPRVSSRGIGSGMVVHRAKLSPRP